MAHTRNPGYIPGDHWMTCDVCGFDYRASQMVKRWDNVMVCRKDYEPRHPQDFVRGRKDRIVPPGETRPPPDNEFTAATCPGHTSARSGIAIAGCAVAGDAFNPSTVVPSGNNNNILTDDDYVEGGYSVPDYV